MFDVMGWAPNGRSYTRLRDVLRRLKSLTIRYENAWWDAAGRGYEEEVATGVISAYKIARQVSGPRTANTTPLSWATWTQQFHQSLLNGNIKRLDLDLFFRLKTPTAQHMYRFLDKRFYNTDSVAMDLIEFACGHIGLTESANVAILKRRLAPAVAELEEIGFLARLDPAERYQKVKAGVWRCSFDAAILILPLPPLTREAGRPGEPPAGRAGAGGDAAQLAAEYYRLWDETAMVSPGPRDLEHAETLLRDHDPETAKALIACLVRMTKKRWPDCRSLSGAVQKYLPEALRLHQLEQRREAGARKPRPPGVKSKNRYGRASRPNGVCRKHGADYLRRSARKCGAAYWRSSAARRRRRRLFSDCVWKSWRDNRQASRRDEPGGPDGED